MCSALGAFRLVCDPRPRHFLDMPTVLRAGPYRFFFYASDGVEPPHVHVERESSRAKFWLNPVRLQESGGLPRAEIGRVAVLVEQNRDLLLQAWNDFFGD